MFFLHFRPAEGEIRKLENAKIAVFTCPFDITQTETKGTVLINTADELKSFSRGTEVEVEKVNLLESAYF